MPRASWTGSLCLAVLTLGALAAAPGPASAQGAQCDRHLSPVPGNYGYSPRAQGHRCEGLYESTVSAVRLEMVSLLQGRLRYELGRHKRLRVSAPDLSGLDPRPVRVRAVALPLKTYYRMDAVLPAGGAMDWPLDDIVERVNLPAEQVGVFGWVQGDGEKIFVPLRVAPAESDEAAADAPIELIVRSAVDLERLLWRTVSADEQVIDQQEHGGGSIRAGRPVLLSLPGSGAALLRVEVAAKAVNSDHWTKLSIRLVRPDG